MAGKAGVLTSEGRSGSPAVAMAPWVAEPYALWSLWEIMERTQPEKIMDIVSTMEVFVSRNELPPLLPMRMMLLELSVNCKTLGLASALKIVDRLDGIVNGGAFD